ncbi:hypothetical protein B0H11DRAFT_1918211 [Mycena galericulata]|nr:hypothetical protein B0H11DRAFT_1918211 [Mycena galericulata]
MPMLAPSLRSLPIIPRVQYIGVVLPCKHTSREPAHSPPHAYVHALTRLHLRNYAAPASESISTPRKPPMITSRAYQQQKVLAGKAEGASQALRIDVAAAAARGYADGVSAGWCPVEQARQSEAGGGSGESEERRASDGWRENSVGR